MGDYDPDDLPSMLFMIDIFINPSLNESYSFTVREAFSASIPVIASDVGAMHEIVDNYLNGYLFKDEESLRKVMGDITLNSHLIRSPQLTIPKIKTIEQDTQEWIKRYEKLL